MTDGYSLRKQTRHGDDRPGNRKSKNPIDDVHDYFYLKESNEGEIRVSILPIIVTYLLHILLFKANLCCIIFLGLFCCFLVEIFCSCCVFDCMLVKTDTGDIISLKVKGLDTIGSVKLKIQAAIPFDHIPFDHQELIFNGKLLHNSNTLANLPIKKRSPTFTLMRKSEELMEIFVNTFTGKTISLWVKPTYTIHQVKSDIKRQEGIQWGRASVDLQQNGSWGHGYHFRLPHQ
ncbi:putative Ubiquitin-like domain-containing protein [Helianthus annuus]|nr:putative Ubiquitin-like domain-containing protein [Helianthus annuus]